LHQVLALNAIMNKKQQLIGRNSILSTHYFLVKELIKAMLSNRLQTGKNKARQKKKTQTYK